LVARSSSSRGDSDRLKLVIPVEAASLPCRPTPPVGLPV